VDDILAAFASLNVWAKGARRAPHKPLLILLALGEWQRGNRGPLPFAAVEPRLRDLLRQFGPPRADGPEDPFWRLKNDRVWELGGTDHLADPAATAPPKLDALRDGVTGRFSADVRAALERSPELVARLARAVLDARFPESLHADILAAVGLDIAAAEAITPPAVDTDSRRRRDPRFRDAVLSAYGECCAVCGVGMRFVRTTHLIGIEAAHVMWFQAGGPDVVTNGLALCSLHHKAFDLGAFTVEPGGRVVVSAEVFGAGSEESLVRYHDRPTRSPVFDTDRPAPEHLAWHREEVFRGRPRS
jgi:putative restriction endonuclease